LATPTQHFFIKKYDILYICSPTYINHRSLENCKIKSAFFHLLLSYCYLYESLFFCPGEKLCCFSSPT